MINVTRGKVAGKQPPRVTLTFQPPAPPISMNDGDTWKTRRNAKLWRERAYWAWLQHHPAKGPTQRRYPPADIHTTITFTTNRRRDPINYSRTVKHIVDGLVDAGAWPDDNPTYVTQHHPTLTHATTPTITITITPRVAPPS